MSTALPFRDLDVSLTQISRYKNKNTGKFDIGVSFGGVRRKLEMQLGDAECTVTVITDPKVFEGADPGKPSIFLNVSDPRSIQKFKEVDAKILSLVAESTDPEINKLKPDRYSALLKPPVPGKSDGTSINMKFMVDRCEKKKYDSRTGTWIDGTLLDLNRDSVEALYIGFSFSSIWAIRSDWGLSMWANKFYIMPSTKSTMLTLPKPMPRAAVVEDDDTGDNTEEDNGDDENGGDDGENVDGGRKKVRVG